MYTRAADLAKKFGLQVLCVVDRAGRRFVHSIRHLGLFEEARNEAWSVLDSVDERETCPNFHAPNVACLRHPWRRLTCGSLRSGKKGNSCVKTQLFLLFLFLFSFKKSNGPRIGRIAHPPENGARVYGEERARHLLGLPVFFDLYLRAHDTHKGDTKSICTHAFVSLSFLPLAFLLLSFHHLRASQSPLVLHVPLSFLGCFPIISLLSRGDLFPFPL